MSNQQYPTLTDTKKLLHCIAKDCFRSPQRRGLCDRCFSRLRRQVYNGKTTWRELEKQGLCNPPRRTNGKPNCQQEYTAEELAELCRKVRQDSWEDSLEPWARGDEQPTLLEVADRYLENPGVENSGKLLERSRAI